MKILISPAKSLDYTSELPTQEFTSPQFLQEAKKIQKVLKSLKPKDLASLMKISDNLADLNWKRNQERTFTSSEINHNARQAIFAFNGDVYDGLNAYQLPQASIQYLQEHLRILSGLYGLLQPLDLIEPYRLEMGTKLPIEANKDLYAFWKPKLAQKLESELNENEVIINLSSHEYFSAIDKKAIQHTIITPEFKELRNGQLKTIGFFAKKARGQMVRYMAIHQITDVQQIKAFAEDGYSFDENGSTANKWLFTR